jgi:outer membrane protein assembly factor BamA
VARDPASIGAIGALGAEAAGAIEGRDDLYVRFYIDEGRREVVDDVQIKFVGAHKKSDADVRRRLKLLGGVPFTEAAFSEDKEAIVKLYTSTGQPYVKVSYADSRWNDAHDRYLLVYQIEEDGEVRFGEIIIRGNFKTLDRVIMQDLPFRAGERFDLTKVDEGERNLRTHLIFNSVRVVPLGLAGGRNPVPVLVTVQERYLERFGTLGIAGGIQTDKLPYYAYLQAGWFWGNFFGLGSQIELRFDTGFSDQSLGVQLRYTDLRAFGPGWRHDATGFWRRDITHRLGPVETYGLSLALTRNLTPSLRVFGRYDIYRAQISVGFNRVDGPNDLPNINDNTTTAKIAFGVVWDRRVGADGQLNALAPAKGWLLSAQAGWATPYLGGDHQFLFVSGQAMGILPFKVRGAEFTLSGNLRYDEGIPIGESALPVVERYFAGGDTSTRGYDTDQLKTEIIRSQVSPLSGLQGFRVIPQGGNIRFLSTIELQFPIAKKFLGVLPFPWVGAIFYDAGAVVDALNLIGWSDIKHSVGLSLLRVLTPVGPLSFEYAYPLTQSLAEERWKTSPWYSHYPGRFHFNWGIPLSR